MIYMKTLRKCKGNTLSKGEMECTAGEKFDYLHENLLESVQALHYPKG